jgi:hypothetical protein
MGPCLAMTLLIGYTSILFMQRLSYKRNIIKLITVKATTVKGDKVIINIVRHCRDNIACGHVVVTYRRGTSVARSLKLLALPYSKEYIQQQLSYYLQTVAM